MLNKFGQKKAKEVYERIEQMLEKIALIPEMFPVSKKQKGLIKCVINKQTSIYYRVSKDHLEVISFGNNLKDPDMFTA